MTRRTIQEIEDIRTRDLVRGLLDRRVAPRTTIEKLLATVSRSDLPTVDELLRTHQLFRHLRILDEFPMDAPFQGYRGESLVPTNQLSLEYVAYRIAENEEKICAALTRFGSLNRAIRTDDEAGIVLAISDIVANDGHSLTLARKAAFIIGYAAKDSLAHAASVDLVSAYGINGKNYGMMATIDTIAADFNYLDLKHRFRDYLTLEPSANSSRMIAALCFAPIAASAEEATAIVSASYRISLIDATIAFLAHCDQGILSAKVSETVSNAWSKFAEFPRDGFAYFEPAGPFSNTYAFRSAPAFVEFEPFRHLRLALQPLYDLPDARRDDERPASPYPSQFFAKVRSITDLVPPEAIEYQTFPRVFDYRSAGNLSRSCAVVWICDLNSDFSMMKTESMASLMGSTSEIDRLLPPDILRRAAGTASDDFVKLILLTLLRAHSSATRDSYAFKEEFQRYVRNNHDGHILNFMERARTLDPGIIEYFVNLLDETLLSQMAFLMNSSNAVYEARASLLEWYSDVADHEATRAKAKQLRLDRKIAAVRGVINETRLNIDSVRFRQWIEQTKLPDFSDFIRQQTPNLPNINDLADTSKAPTRFLAAHREPTTRALQALLECFDEFCRNPDFGIASFLGRRIRHGTLRGTLLNGIPDPAKVELPAASLAQYRQWTQEFSNAINTLTGRLFFRSKNAHKDGLLSAEVDSPEKWQICLVCLKSIFERAQQDMGVLFVPLLIEQACWLLFESELTKVQAFIGEARSKWGTLKLRYHPNEENVLAFEKSTNITLSDQFATVISWFRQPPNISPTAELNHIIQVVLQEAKDEYPTFEPETEITGSSDLTLNGATYYVVYDAINIAVRNAAKHGKHPGSLKIDSRIEDVGSASALVITLSSELKEGDCIETALERIEEAGSAGASNADVVENRSGIRKLKKMEIERKIQKFETCGAGHSNDRLCVSITFPYSGILE